MNSYDFFIYDFICFMNSYKDSGVPRFQMFRLTLAFGLRSLWKNGYVPGAAPCRRTGPGIRTVTCQAASEMAYTSTLRFQRAREPECQGKLSCKLSNCGPRLFCYEVFIQ